MIPPRAGTQQLNEVVKVIEIILRWLIGKPWEYGTAIGTRRARRHLRTGEVQVAMLDADGWCATDPAWWKTFEPDAVVSR